MKFEIEIEKTIFSKENEEISGLRIQLHKHILRTVYFAFVIAALIFLCSLLGDKHMHGIESLEIVIAVMLLIVTFLAGMHYWWKASDLADEIKIKKTQLQSKVKNHAEKYLKAAS